MTNVAALSHAYNLMGADYEQKWLLQNQKTNYRSQFLDEGYFLLDIPPVFLGSLRNFFADEIARPFSLADVRPDFWGSDLSKEIETALNRESIYYGQPDNTAIAAIEKLLTSWSGEIERQLAHHWQVVNVRAWSVKPGGQIGANAWHMDDHTRYVRKFMLYLNPPNLENGTIEIVTRKGKGMVVEAPNPTGVLFDSAILKHRGRPGSKNLRPMIEVTLIPALSTSTRYIYAGQNARFPKNPFDFKLAEEPTMYAVTDDFNLAGKLNIGGGPNFKHNGWVNLESVQSPQNPFPFMLSPSAVFPVASSSIQLVYSSHCLEQLDDATVAQTLKEARRVLGSEGILLLKLPENAWGRDELVSLLAKNGLRVLSFDREKIVRNYAQHVPGINEMFDISLYCIAEPA
jgi:predicted SAM-dependent methyltransferase